MVESIYFLKPAWCGNHLAGLRPEIGLTARYCSRRLPGGGLSLTNALLVAGHQYWLSEVPTDPIHTGIGWGLASPGYPGIQLPIAETSTGVNSGWGPTGLNIANEFSGSGTTVPEPAALGMSALVLLSLIGCRRAK